VIGIAVYMHVMPVFNVILYFIANNSIHTLHTML